MNHRFSCRKEPDDIKTAVCQKTAGRAPTEPVYGRSGIRHIGGLILGEATAWNVGTFGVDANGEATSGLNHEGEEYGCDTKGRSTPYER